jgi:hypothetical protein
MGSSGTGSFGNYFPGDEAKNLCGKSINKVVLEDVIDYEYYRMFNDVPNVGVEVKVRETLLSKRLVVETLAGQAVGALPTKYNYLLACIRGGRSYSGKVLYSQNKPVPMVEVNLDAI